MITSIRQAEKSMLQKLDSFVDSKKEQLKLETNVEDLETRTYEWY